MNKSLAALMAILVDHQWSSRQDSGGRGILHDNVIDGHWSRLSVTAMQTGWY